MDAQTKLDLFGSDSEDDDDAPVPAPAAAGADDDVDEDDLFGGDDDDDEGGAAAEGAAAEVKEEEEPSKRGLAPPQELELPQMPAPPADAKLVLLKLPNILSREARPFDPETFADEGMDEESNAHLRLENVIRWRDVDGERQSNTRLVRWSDGSMTLHVGSEVLSATSQPLGKRGAGQEATQLFVRHKGAIFRCHGVLRERLLVQPTSTKSETHKALTKQIAKSHVKERRIKVVTTAEDPEKKKADDEKAWRQSNQLASAQEARRQRYSSGPELTEDFLEADDESQLEGNLGALKRGFKADQKRRAGGGGGARGAPGGKRALEPVAVGARRVRGRGRGGRGGRVGRGGEARRRRRRDGRLHRRRERRGGERRGERRGGVRQEEEEGEEEGAEVVNPEDMHPSFTPVRLF